MCQDYAHKKSRPFERAAFAEFGVAGLHQPLGSIVMMVLEAILVPNDLTIQLIDQFIHSRIQVCMRAFCKHIAAFDVDIALGTLPSLLFLLFFHREKHFDIDNLVKVAGNSIKLGRNVTAQGWGNLKVMTADRQVHR
jgi:hypothetical protein